MYDCAGHHHLLYNRYICFFALVEKNVKKKKYAEKLARVEKMLF